jgi:hypothetical protein
MIQGTFQFRFRRLPTGKQRPGNIDSSFPSMPRSRYLCHKEGAGRLKNGPSLCPHTGCEFDRDIFSLPNIALVELLPVPHKNPHRPCHPAAAVTFATKKVQAV